MHTIHRSTLLAIVAAAFAVSAPNSASAASLVASYGMQGTLASSVPGAPSLTQTDPLGGNTFVTDTVFGSTRKVFLTVGNNIPVTDQAGLSLDTTGLVSPNNYTVRDVFLFSDRNGEWRRILDVENRQSDNGFYVDPSNNLDLFPVAGSSNAFTTSIYHDVFLTVSNSGGTSTVTAYLDGVEQFSQSSSLMDIDNPNDPGNLLNFYLDNTVGGGQGEWSPSRTALIQVWNGALSAGEVDRISGTLPSAAVPEPSALAGMAFAVLGVAALALRRRKPAAA